MLINRPRMSLVEHGIASIDQRLVLDIADVIAAVLNEDEPFRVAVGCERRRHFGSWTVHSI